MKALASNVLVVGLGMTGISVVRFLQQHYPNTHIRVIDTRPEPAGKELLPCDVSLHCGSFRLDWVLSSELIIANPGVALATPELKQAAKKNIPIIGDIELFARHVKAPVIGITGSNGKSTVTALLGEMAKAAKLNIAVGGNIGVAALDLLAQDANLYILELSSFQLETTFSLQMQAGAFLNLSEDHLDRYEGMQAYKEAKLRLYEQSMLAIFNADDKQTHPINSLNKCSFGFEKGDYCLQIIEQEEWLCAKGIPVIKAQEIGLVGRHNVANCLAAMALADAANIDRKAQISAMRNYQGLAHRCQKIVVHQGVLWVNDSKATNPASTLAALDGLQLTGKLHLLLGGDGKGADFSALGPALAKQNVQLYCFGKDANLLAALGDAIVVSSLTEAMQKAAKLATFGDMVLLSPACASLDQFTSFIHRGEVFAEFARTLVLESAHG